MDGDLTPTLLLTRPQLAAERFLRDVEEALGARVPAIISPVMRIEPVGELPEAAATTGYIFTSSNAVEIMAGAGALASRDVRTVGERTAAAARDAGAEALCLGETVDAFIDSAQLIDWPGRWQHLRGVHTRGNLTDSLRDLGARVDEVLLYDQVAQPLSRAAQQALAANSPIILPLFSPRTAKLAATAFGQSAPVDVIAISQATAQAWPEPSGVEVVDAPTAAAMCAAVVAAFRSRRLGDSAASH